MFSFFETYALVANSETIESKIYYPAPAKADFFEIYAFFIGPPSFGVLLFDFIFLNQLIQIQILWGFGVLGAIRN